MSGTRRITIAALAAVLAVLLAVVAVAEMQREGTGPGSAAPADSIDPQAASELGALRRPRGEGDALPAEAAGSVADSALSGANPQLSRRALSRGGRTVYLVPGRQSVCLVTVDGSGTVSTGCTHLGQITESTPFTSHSGCSVGADGIPACTGATLVGVVPDGVPEVAVEFETGKPITTPVENNAYMVDVALDPRPTALSYAIGSVTVRQPVPVMAGKPTP